MSTNKQSKLKAWMTQATPEWRKRMADLAGTTVGTLHQIVGGYRTDGEVSTTPATAARIEEATRKLQSITQLPVVRREDMCRSCRECDILKKARKDER